MANDRGPESGGSQAVISEQKSLPSAYGLEAPGSGGSSVYATCSHPGIPRVAKRRWGRTLHLTARSPRDWRKVVKSGIKGPKDAEESSSQLGLSIRLADPKVRTWRSPTASSYYPPVPTLSLASQTPYPKPFISNELETSPQNTY